MIQAQNQEKCSGCGTCAEICPLDVFRMDPVRDVSSIKYRDDCQTCYTCELECPEQAIYINPFPKEKRQPW
ncbi:MAG: ferredoxin family protein [Proteobacteria bacterium]|nr:ferredoxin family protein [Pseudomonadota bacterium]